MRRYLAMDAGGARVSSGDSIRSLLPDDTDPPAWETIDAIHDVDGYALRCASVRADTVDIPVRFRIVASVVVVDDGWKVGSVQQPREQTLIFRAIRTPAGWRVVPPEAPPHVYAAYLLRRHLVTEEKLFRGSMTLAKKRWGTH